VSFPGDRYRLFSFPVARRNAVGSPFPPMKAEKDAPSRFTREFLSCIYYPFFPSPHSLKVQRPLIGEKDFVTSTSGDED